MTTYNGEKYLHGQLDSIAHQDLRPIELVITDDGSTDNTLDIVEDFAASAPFPVRIFRNETRLGYADNFLKAASLCEGELIAFCDQDDIWLEKKLKICAESFRDPTILLAIHSARTLCSGEQGSWYPHFSADAVLDSDSCDPFANRPGFAMVFRQEILNLLDNRNRPERLHSHDRWLWFVAAGFGRIGTIAEVLTLHRQHNANTCGAPRKRSFEEQVQISARSFEYDHLADSEFACANLLHAAAEQHPERAELLAHSAGLLELRSRFHRMRAGIYASQSTVLSRINFFAQILCSAGYFSNLNGTRLGFRAGFKDLVFGVPGLYRLLPGYRQGICHRDKSSFPPIN